MSGFLFSWRGFGTLSVFGIEKLSFGIAYLFDSFGTLSVFGIEKLLNGVFLSKNVLVLSQKGVFIHSDQVFHYTNPQFQKMVKDMGLGQSMSRRGNCWDNAPQESFFGHFKDESDFKLFEDVTREIKSYMIYYNHYRGAN